MELSVYIFGMLLYTLGGGLHFGFAASHFKAGHYFRAGFYGMFAVSMVLLMAELIFR